MVVSIMERMSGRPGAYGWGVGWSEVRVARQQLSIRVSHSSQSGREG